MYREWKHYMHTSDYVPGRHHNLLLHHDLCHYHDSVPKYPLVPWDHLVSKAIRAKL